MEAMTHVAGPTLSLDDRYLRQRCAWCGAILLDYDLESIAVPDGQPGPSTWPVGAWVSVAPGMSFVVDEEKAPADSCMQLPAEATK